MVPPFATASNVLWAVRTFREPAKVDPPELEPLMQHARPFASDSSDSDGCRCALVQRRTNAAGASKRNLKHKLHEGGGALPVDLAVCMHAQFKPHSHDGPFVTSKAAI